MKVALTWSGIHQLSIHVNASAPYVSVHEPLLYSRKNRLIKRQLVDLRYSLCLRGKWLFLSLSLLSVSICINIYISVFSRFSPRCSPTSTRFTCLSSSLPRRPVFPPFFLFAFLFLPAVWLRRCAPLPTFTYHNTQWKNVVSLSNYKIRCECTVRAAHFLRLIAIFFLASISSGFDLGNPLQHSASSGNSRLSIDASSIIAITSFLCFITVGRLLL